DGTPVRGSGPPDGPGEAIHQEEDARPAYQSVLAPASADGHVLGIFMRSPDRRKVEAVRRGRCQYALVSGPGIFFLMYRFARAIGWSAAPYWGAILPNEERSVPAE